MDKILVEYVGGPADGQRATLLPAPDGNPSTWVAVPVPERFRQPSALDPPDPPDPPPLQRYILDPAASTTTLTRYRYSGPL